MSKSFVFTWNNYTDETLKYLNELECSYMVYGKEVAPTTGTRHLQGYVEFEKQKKFTTVVNLFQKQHVELRKGSQQQAIDYCCKDKEFTTRGSPACTKQGKRSDIEHARESAKAGGMRLVSKTTNSLQALKVAQVFLEYNEKARDYKPTVTWIWGESGSGKSRKARELLKDDVYTKNDGTKWWNGYDGHENVIIDDFRDSWWSITEMLSLLDRYEKKVEVKGSVRQFRGRQIVVTSIHHPNTMYKNCHGEPIVQLLRRIDEVINLTISKPVEEVSKPVEEVKTCVISGGNIETPGNCTQFDTVEEVEEVGGNTKAPPSSHPEDNIDEPNWELLALMFLARNTPLEDEISEILTDLELED